MAKRTIKQIREEMESLAKVKNKETLLAAIPLLVEMQERLATLRKTIRNQADIVLELSEDCSNYALNHVSSVFVNGLVTDGKGVRHGDVDVNGTIYHFSAGYGKLVRDDGDNMTQDFLGGLPEKWIKGKLELDQTAITKLGVTADELLKAGLVKSANNVWSLPVAVYDVGE